METVNGYRNLYVHTDNKQDFIRHTEALHKKSQVPTFCFATEVFKYLPDEARGVLWVCSGWYQPLCCSAVGDTREQTEGSGD